MYIPYFDRERKAVWILSSVRTGSITAHCLFCLPVRVVSMQCRKIGLVEQLGGLTVEVDGALVVGGGSTTRRVGQMLGEVWETTQCH